MRIRFFIDKENGIIIEQFFGNVSLRLIMESIPHIWNLPDYSADYDGLIDFRFCKLDFSHEEFIALADQISESDKGLKGNTAFLVSEPIAAAVATLYQERMKDFHDSAIFCFEEQVLQYLEADAEIFNKLDSDSASELKFGEPA